MGEMNGALKDTPQASTWLKIKETCRLLFSSEIYEEIAREEEEKARAKLARNTPAQGERQQES